MKRSFQRLCALKKLQQGFLRQITYLKEVSCHDCVAERHPSATAAGEPSPAEAKKQQISRNRRKQKGRRVWAAGSGLSGRNILM